MGKKMSANKETRFEQTGQNSVDLILENDSVGQAISKMSEEQIKDFINKFLEDKKISKKEEE